MDGCDAVHINLTQEAELAAMEHVTALAGHLERVSYVSATTACEENRWFEVVDVKMRTEHLLARSGLPAVVLCPTWVMETLHNFVHGDRCVVVAGRDPPPLHFFAADDFGRIVADSYADRRAMGRRLYIHGPEAVTLPDALERFFAARHPGKKITRLSLRQARLVGWLARREGLRYVTGLIDYFDRVGELGDPKWTNSMYGAPATTLDAWLGKPQKVRGGLPH
jgi:uncharacterized protein YbjT (DUF2867 family)